MSATNPAADWFFEIGTEVHGPFTYSELQQKAAAGELVAHTPVREGSDGRWVFAETVQGLFQPSDSPPPAATPVVDNAHAFGDNYSSP